MLPWPAGVGARVKLSKYTMPVIETQTVTRGGKGKNSTTIVKTSRSSATQTGRKKGNNKNKNKAKAMSTLGNFNSMVATNHWRMLRDPCHASLAESAYAGRSGITSRFVNINTYTGTSNTAFFSSYAPCPLSRATVLAADATTAITPVFSSDMPGAAFITANADCYRIIGCCLGIEYIGTELNRSGAVYGGVLPTSVISGGAATTIDTVKVLLGAESRTPDAKTLEILWFPGTDDTHYNKRTDAGNFDDTHNSIVFCAENLPSGVQLKIRQTVIIEWLPKIGLGMSMPPPAAGSNPPAFYEALHTKASQDPAFSNAFASGAGERARGYAYYAGQRMVDASVGLAVGAVGRMARQGRIGS